MDVTVLSTRNKVTPSIVGVLLFSSLALSACGQSSRSYATQACTYVNRSISDLEDASKSASSNQANLERYKALVLLRQALPLAALAASTNGSYQALQATLSESNRVPESTLLTALHGQCLAVASNGDFNIPSSTTTP